jgi:very-short-patch-repair endonuclease
MGEKTEVDRKTLAQTLRGQHEVIARWQALVSGVTPAALRHCIRTGGPWQIMLPGIYLTITGMATTEQREMAALLYAGPHSVITGAAALRRNGIRAAHSEMVDVLVPVTRRSRSIAFVQIQRTTRMPEQICVSGKIRFAMAARAVADTARVLTSLPEVRGVVAGAVQQGRCPLGLLTRELSQGPARGSALLRAALSEVADGIRSAAEGDFKDLLKRARLPTPMFNARLYDHETLIAIVDCWWPRARVVAEVDSREYHLSPEDWERTRRRHARLTAQGILVLHFSPYEIRTEPEVVVARIRSALAAGHARHPVPLRALPSST